MQTFDFRCEIANRPQDREASIAYLAEHLHFLKRREKVLICFPEEQAETIRSVMIQAVERCGAEPVVWQGDFRWKSLLRLAFSTRATTAIGTPIIILGLAKLARAGNTPLYIRNVVTAGYPCLDWMRDGITKGLDCTLRICFEFHMSNLIVGFSCEKSAEEYICADAYTAAIADSDENAPDTDILQILTYLHSWSSILDCSIQKGECGLELEIIVFPGEKLPTLPNCAKRIVREWNPETDEPMWYLPSFSAF